ncbi:unnamed protein product [Rotaria sp. Silwood1]|nr:unnamed protein product [Rotaria sp. Silwood1]
MIFIHGGNFQFTDASQPVFESEHLVNTTNVIVVLIQYRLGVLGFFATGTGPNDIKGNYGILDQRLAIAWVKANIDAFGGDPNEITLFGQSAGAQSTALHYVTSEMQLFFQRAIIQSSPMTIQFRTYLEYVTPGTLLAEQLHCAIGNVTCFRTRSTNEIIAAQNIVNKMLTSLDILFFFEPWTPVIDNVIVHGQLLDIVRNISFPLKPLIIGTVIEESLDFVYGTWQKPLSPSEYIGIGLIIFRENAFKVLKQYPPDSSDDQRPLLSRVATQWVFACSTRVFARKAASYYYVFSYPFDTINSKNRIQCSNHACHGDELPFTFESHWDNFTDAGRRISQSMATYWTNFAKSEDPNEPLRVSIPWPRVTIGNETYMYFQDPLYIGQNYLKSDCDFWDKIGYKNYFLD